MQLQTILNRVEKYKSFVYGRTCLVENPAGRPTIEVEIRARANGQAMCSGCRRKRPGYDRLPERRVGVVSFWGVGGDFLLAPPGGGWLPGGGGGGGGVRGAGEGKGTAGDDMVFG